MGDRKLDRKVAIRRANRSIRGSNYEDLWYLTDDLKEVLNADDADLIWVETPEELREELQRRYPAPKGFSRVTLDRRALAVLPIRVKEELVPNHDCTAEDIIGAIKEGLPVIKQVSTTLVQNLLAHYGYDQDEIGVLIRHSRLEYIPLGDNLVISRAGSLYSLSVVHDKELFAEAQRRLTTARKLRHSNRKQAPVRAVGSCEIRWFLDELFADMVANGIPGCLSLVHPKTVNAASRSVLQVVEFYTSVLGNHKYRTLDSYIDILRVWADPKSRKKTRTRMKKRGRMPKHLETFLQWLDEELAYCRKRKFKFARAPKAHKKG